MAHTRTHTTRERGRVSVSCVQENDAQFGSALMVSVVAYSAEVPVAGPQPGLCSLFTASAYNVHTAHEQCKASLAGDGHSNGLMQLGCFNDLQMDTSSDSRAMRSDVTFTNVVSKDNTGTDVSMLHA